MRKEEKKSSRYNCIVDSKETEGRKPSHTHELAYLVRLWRYSYRLLLRDTEYERSYLTVMGFRKALRHPSWEGFGNLAFVKLWCFAYVLCPAVKRAHCRTWKQRTNGWQLLSPAVCTRKHNTIRGHAAAVVGGNGSKDIAGGKRQLGTQKKKQLGFGSNRWEQESENYS